MLCDLIVCSNMLCYIMLHRSLSLWRVCLGQDEQRLRVFSPWFNIWDLNVRDLTVVRPWSNLADCSSCSARRFRNSLLPVHAHVSSLSGFLVDMGFSRYAFVSTIPWSMHVGAVAKPPLHKPPLACAQHLALQCFAGCHAMPCCALPCP